MLKAAELPFKLNSLRWFLTLDGKKFLYKQGKRYILDQKIAVLNLNQIASRITSNYDGKKFGEDREYKKEIKNISDFLA